MGASFAFNVKVVVKRELTRSVGYADGFDRLVGRPLPGSRRLLNFRRAPFPTAPPPPDSKILRVAP
jgi:hypothetical protein